MYYYLQHTLICPGWNNSEGCIVKRNDPTPAHFYTACWAAVLAARPEHIVINSWNEFAEQTAIEPADSRTAPEGCDAWVDDDGKFDPYRYWVNTQANIALWRDSPSRAKA